MPNLGCLAPGGVGRLPGDGAVPAGLGGLVFRDTDTVLLPPGISVDRFTEPSLSAETSVSFC